jgi:hypothetical protein
MPAPSSLQKIVAYLQDGPSGVETLLSGPRSSMSDMAVKTTEETPNYFAKLKEYEGFKPYVYLDSKKIPTAGLGHKVLKGENFNGYTEEDLAFVFKIERQSIGKIINGICRKIYKENENYWLNEFIYWNQKKVKLDYKKCSKCKKYLSIDALILYLWAATNELSFL